jgi:nitrite reductase/ring-hydroxylating ferredoxin subunit/uncharacterized membrane protein
MTVTSQVIRLVKRIERLEALDNVAKPLQQFVSRCIKPRVVRNALSGTNIGHPLHPMLTDVPIGMWSAAAALDAMGGRRARPAADLLVGAGIVAAVPTALSGLNDWSDTYGADTRVGLLHASSNTTALLLYAASLVTRVRGRRGVARALGFAGLGALATGGYLGGYLSFVKGVNVNRTAFEDRPTDWTRVAAGADLADGTALKVVAGTASIMLYRKDGRVRALANTCTHMGGPLNEGTIDDGCVTGPWHGSTFKLDDGSIVRGPASTPQPTYDVRVVDGEIEVRVAAAS